MVISCAIASGAGVTVFFKERCDGMLAVDPLEHFAGETWNADDSRGGRIR